jgi:hypothetical protein
MRAILALALLAVATPASADSYVGLAGGLDLPLSDDQYTDAVDTSPTLGIRVGSAPHNLGGYLSFDWMPANLKNDGGGGIDITAHRFRLMVGPEMFHDVSNTLTVTGRAGIGLDIARSHAEGTFLGVTVDESETDTGLGFEFAGGVWAHLGGLYVGGEVALPVGIHSEDNNEAGSYDYDYTAVDLQLLFSVRFVSRSN